MRPATIPPVRRLFVPEPGHVLFEADQKRADPQVVAKESGEENLLRAFREGADVYTDNGKWAYEKDRLTVEERQWNKNGVNGINYGCKAKTLAQTIHTTERKADEYIERWLGPRGLYPGIGLWHRRIDSELRKTKTVYNVYGFRRYYTDRVGALLPQALAWIASSTVSVTINRSMKHIFGPSVFRPAGVSLTPEQRLDPWSGEEYIGIPEVRLFMQIHDSVIGQVPAAKADTLLPQIVKFMEVPIPYTTPLVIPVTLKVSGKSWGDVENWSRVA